MDSLETIFLKGLIRRLLQYSIIAPEINFARRCHLISLDFQEKIFLDCNRIVLFISIEQKYLQCGESWRCHCVFFYYRFLHQFLNVCLSGSVFFVVVVLCCVFRVSYRVLPLKNFVVMTINTINC